VAHGEGRSGLAVASHPPSLPPTHPYPLRPRRPSLPGREADSEVGVRNTRVRRDVRLVPHEVMEFRLSSESEDGLSDGILASPLEGRMP
jgi:hypothetical protein